MLVVAVAASWCRSAAAFMGFVLSCTMDEKIAQNNWPNEFTYCNVFLSTCSV